MRRKNAWIWILVVLVMLLSACSDPQVNTGTNTTGTQPSVPQNGECQILVAPDGDDAADGVSAPVRTVARALALAAEKIKTGHVTIALADGTYSIDEPLNITQEETSREEGYVLTLKGSGNSMISGGVPVTGWENHAQNIWKASLPDVDVVNGFYVDGENMSLARMEVSGGFIDAAGKGGIVLNTRHRYSNFQNYNTAATIVSCVFRIQKGYSLSYDALKADIGNIIMFFDQTFSRTKFSFSDVEAVASGFVFTADEQTLNTLNGAKMADYSLGKNRYYLANSYLFLDTEGEYYFDTESRTLYYYSASSPADKDCVVPVSQGLLNIQGTNGKLASNIRIENLTFAYGTSDLMMTHSFKEVQSDAIGVGLTGEDPFEYMPLPAQITLDRASNVEIENCKFINMDSTGIAMREHVYNVSLTDSDIKNVSGSGIAVGTFNLKNGYGISDKKPHPDDLTKVYAVKKNSVIPAQITIRNNWIENCGIEAIGSNGILIYYGYNVHIANNTVNRTGGTGISLGWGWGNWSIKKNAPQTCGNILVEANEVLSSCMRVDDVGGIYTLGAFFEDGCMIRNNFIDMKGACENSIPTIYLDEGSEGVTATGNVSVNTKMWLHCRALPLETSGGKVTAGTPKGNTIMNCTISGNYTSITTKQLGYGGAPWPYASEVVGANVTIGENTTDPQWRNNETIMAIVNAAGATR